MALYPITEYGSTSQLDLLRYAERDFYGVEAPAASPAEPNVRGFNKIAAWTQRVGDTLEAEHYLSGVHSTVKIGRAVVVLNYDVNAGTYVATDDSYVQSTSGVITRGSSAIASTPTKVAAGHVEIELAAAMPGTDCKLVNYSMGGWTAAGAVGWVSVYLDSMSSTTVFRIYILTGGSPDVMSLNHASVNFLLHY